MTAHFPQFELKHGQDLSTPPLPYRQATPALCDSLAPQTQTVLDHHFSPSIMGIALSGTPSQAVEGNGSKLGIARWVRRMQARIKFPR